MYLNFQVHVPHVTRIIQNYLPLQAFYRIQQTENNTKQELPALHKLLAVVQSLLPIAGIAATLPEPPAMAMATSIG